MKLITPKLQTDKYPGNARSPIDDVFPGISVTKGVAFTVNDATFLHLVTSDQSYHGSDRPFVDPFQLDPVLQRLVVMTQLVSRSDFF